MKQGIISRLISHSREQGFIHFIADALSLIPRLVSFFELKLPAKPGQLVPSIVVLFQLMEFCEGTALSWDLQKVNNILQMLKVD